MDLFLSRQEIRRLIRGVIGDSTDDLVSSQQNEQVNALIDQAATDVASHCRWLALKRRASVGLDIAQETLGYQQIEQAYWLEGHYPSQYLPLTFGTAADTFAPADLASAALQYVGPGNIIEVAVWDGDARRYTKLPRMLIPVEQDQDRWTKNAQEQAKLAALDGDTAAEINDDIDAETALSEAQRGMPILCDPRLDGLHFYPIGDVRRVIRVSYTISPSWGYHQQVLNPTQIDQIPSSVDAQAIQFAVLADMYAQQGDTFQSLRYRKDSDVPGREGTGKFWNRIRQLKAFQNTGESIPLDSTCTFDEDRDLPDRTIPNWDLRPIIR